MIEMRQILSFFPEELRIFPRNLLREYLQVKVLEIIYDSRFGDSLTFMGGTAIHIVHGGPRFSEDLDFDNRGLGLPEWESLGELLRSKLELQGLAAEVRASARGAFRLSLRFPGLLRRQGLSTDPREKVDLKLDAEPQKFAYEAESVLINKFDVFGRIMVAPADLLLAQKVACLFLRPRPMGRDVFDALFLWAKTEPRPEYLREKLGIGSGAELKERLLRRCRELDFGRLAEDAAPFLFRADDAKRVRLFPEFVRGREFTFLKK